MSRQSTDTILMIRPVNFGFNQQTAINNYYQKEVKEQSNEELHQKAVFEFDQFVDRLRSKDINVEIIEDTKAPFTPDSIFPNNWISFHDDGTICLYPMYAENRRLERRKDILDTLSLKFILKTKQDLTPFEKENKFFEGTGSVVLDRINKIAYASISERTHSDVMSEFCKMFDYENVSFSAYQNVGSKRLPIYHTNVLMCVATEFVVICLESIDDLEERKKIEERIKKSGKKLIAITEEQKNNFAGNMLEVRSDTGNYYTIMSSAAYLALDKEQIKEIENFSEIIHSPLDTIETLGGGSARCMMAEVFLPKK